MEDGDRRLLGVGLQLYKAQYMQYTLTFTMERV